MQRLRILPGAWVGLLSVAASMIVQSRIFGGFFFADDYLHLYRAANGPIQTAILAPHGGHLLLTYNACWWLFYKLFGAEPTGYFAIVFLVHALNVYLLFKIIRQSTNRLYLAGFAAAVWGMCPINPGTLGWLSVFGHVFATTAVLWILLEVAQVQGRNRSLTSGVVIRWYFLLLIASTTFGTGLGIAMGFGAVIFLLDPDPPQRNRLAITFGSLIGVIPVLYFLSNSMWANLTGEPAVESAIPLLTLLGSTPDILAMFLKTMTYGVTALLLGPLVVGRGAIVPFETLLLLSSAVGIAILGGLLVSFIKSSPERRRQFLAYGCIICCCYGIIAVGRYYFDQWDAPRYHYLGPAVMSILLSLAVSDVRIRQSWIRARVWVPRLFVLWLVVVIIPYSMASRTPESESTATLERKRVRVSHARAVKIIERRVAASPPGENVFIPNRPFYAGFPFGGDAFPGLAAFFLIIYPDNTVDGRRVRFVEPRASAAGLIHAQEGSRLADLIVTRAGE